MTHFQEERRQRVYDSRLVNVDFQNNLPVQAWRNFWAKPTRVIICPVPQRLNWNWLATCSHAVLDSNTFYRLNLNPANDEKSLRIIYRHLLTPAAIWSLPFNSRCVWSINKGQNGLAESERRARSTIRLRGFVVRYKKLSSGVCFFSRLTWLIQAWVYSGIDLRLNNLKVERPFLK